MQRAPPFPSEGIVISIRWLLTQQNVQQHEAHQQFNLAELQKAILAFSPNGIVREIQPTRPLWTEPNPLESSQALIPVSTALTLQSGGKYEYIQDPNDPKSGKAILNLTQPIPCIQIDRNDDKSIRAGVQLAKAMGAHTIMIHDNMPVDVQKKIDACCKEYGLSLKIIPSPKLKQEKPLEITDAPRQVSHTPTPLPIQPKPR